MGTWLAPGGWRGSCSADRMDDSSGPIEPIVKDWSAEEALRRKQRRIAIRWLLVMVTPLLLGWWALLAWGGLALIRGLFRLF